MQTDLKIILFIIFYFLPQASSSDNEDIERLEIIDWHTHVAGLGHGGSGNFVNDTMRRNFRFKFFMRWMNVNESELESLGDQIVIERLNARLEISRYVDRAVILAIDGRIDGKTGELDWENTLYYVDNDFVASQVNRFPKLLFGASVNPNRPDALSRLEQVYNQGAVLIKWIPSIMDIDPAEEKFVPFYRKMAELDLPLLTHTGNEHAFPGADNSLADPQRLKLALESGVTVIAAHIATTGRNDGERNFDRILPMFSMYHNLYADISSLTQINKLGYLARTLAQPGITERLLYGTDWPLQYFPVVSPWYHLRHIGLRNAWRVGRIKHQWDRDVELKMAFGVPEAVFARTVGRINSLLRLNRE